MFRKTTLIGVLLGCVAALPACNQAPPSGSSELTAEAQFELLQQSLCPTALTAAPTPLVALVQGPEELRFWPFTGNDFTGLGQDPINIIFARGTNPLQIRAALMMLSAERPAFPPVPPFTGIWKDAIGDVQTAYGVGSEWVGGVIQLALGDYQPARFHLRLFQMGEWTVGNAHVEIMIPGTADHQVINWELAEQLVVADFLRTGLLEPSAPLFVTDPINPSPFRTIPAVIYNGLPVELKMLIGGPLDPVSEDVSIATDGRATVLNVTGRTRLPVGTYVEDFTLMYDQIIPRPFCASGPHNYVKVLGPVHLRQDVWVTGLDNYQMWFRADGDLTVIPVNPLTGEVAGEPMQARVLEKHQGMIRTDNASALSMKLQMLSPMTNPAAGWQYTRLGVALTGVDTYQQTTRCAQP